MPRRLGRAHRTRLEWSRRSLLAMLLAGCGYVSVAHSVAYVLRNHDSARAYTIAPIDGRITAKRAQDLIVSTKATVADRRLADELSRLALLQDPTSGAAAGALALSRQISGDAEGARRLSSYARRLSRRDFQAQIWAIEDAVARGNVAGALAHYDIALRTSRKAPDLLFPILTTAMVDPLVRAELVRRLAATPAWGPAFVSYAAAKGSDPRTTARLFIALRHAGFSAPAEASASVINALVVAGHEDEAWSYYSVVRRVTDRRRSRDPRFAASLDVPSVLDWMLLSDDGAAGSIQRDGADAVFEFSAPASVGGPMLRQIQLLPAGDYRLEGRSIGINQPVTSRPYWLLTCRADGRELARVEMSNSVQSGGKFGGTFAVPSNCAAQTLTLIARPSDNSLGLSGRVVRVQIQPL